MSFNALLNQTVTISRRTGSDVHTKETYSAGVDARARFERKASVIVTQEREREPIDGIVFIKPNVDVEVGDRLAYNSTNYKVMAVEDVVLGNGTVHHKELKVQVWRT